MFGNHILRRCLTLFEKIAPHMLINVKLIKKTCREYVYNARAKPPTHTRGAGRICQCGFLEWGLPRTANICSNIDTKAAAATLDFKGKMTKYPPDFTSIVNIV